MSNMREILYAANRAADYSSERLSEQASAIDLAALERIVERTVSRAIVMAHAFDVLKDEGMHPMQAFLHAAECPTTGVTLDDTEFYACLGIWGRWCEAADRANTAVNVSASNDIRDHERHRMNFERRFMQGE